ncbi:glycosyltransferase family 2 protein [Larkinella soli]|uniref:glycosyltransferase family 2 protein n=1 Tax=Larkinella soli TaxID=1770527 RepID=UPI000FFBA96D|nr:glycosyltransferase family 2 protein [Larkinella soli]
MSTPSISVIIPCFNEQEVISETHRRLSQVLKAGFSTYELLFIDDGSSDNTPLILNRLQKEDNCTRVITFSRNFGHQPAVSAGIQHCRGELAVIMDADLQDPPELIPEMVALLKHEQCNVVYGVRTARRGESWFKSLTAKLFYRLINRLSDVPLPLDSGDFRLIDSEVIRAFRTLPERRKYVRGLISWIGFRQVPIYFHRTERFAGSTKYPLRKMLRFARTSLLYFSHKPLRIASSFGLISVGISLAFILWIFYLWMFRPQELVHGWSSLLVAVVFFGGIQLLTIGILGEYLSSMFDELKGRPEFIIRSGHETNFEPPVEEEENAHR